MPDLKWTRYTDEKNHVKIILQSDTQPSLALFSNISVKDVPYWSIDENGFGYIRITRFSRNTYEDFLKALQQIDSEDFIDNNNNGKWDKSENYKDNNLSLIHI